MQIAELINYHHNSSFVKEADDLLLQARTLGPSLRIDRVTISTGIEDPDFKDLGLFCYIPVLVYSMAVFIVLIRLD